jgi:hypothetical protein
MPKINLTNKTKAEQKSIIQNYLIRRSKHKEQGEITVDQLVRKFKHRSLYTDRDKAAHFKKLLHEIKKAESQLSPDA